MMKDDKLILYIERKCSLQEAEEISKWINADSQNKKYFIQLQTIWASIEISKAIANGEPDRESINKILSEVRRIKRMRMYKRIGIYTSFVASVVFLLILITRSEKSTEIINYESYLSDAVLANDIQLTLQNGEIISLSDTSVLINYSDHGEIIINNDTIKAPPKTKPVLHTISIPFGKRSKILLIDGTIVHLNSGTSFVYPSSFGLDEKEVFLDGEAFFEVRKEEDKKFIVKTPFKTIEVSGTSFNVSVDKRNGEFETVLVNGNISLNGEKEKIQMYPNQLYKYHENSKKEILKEVDAYKYISWIYGRIEFEHEALYIVIRRLEKMYNVTIKLLKPDLLTHPISGDLTIKDSPEETMNILMKILVADYNKNDDKFFLLN